MANGQPQKICKNCWSRKYHKQKLYTWKERFKVGVNPADFAASKAAHEKLMADIRSIKKK